MTRIAPCLFLMLLAACGDQHQDRSTLTLDFLAGEEQLAAPLDTAVFRPPETLNPSQRFEGVLEVAFEGNPGGISAVRDWFDYTRDTTLKLAELPPFHFEFVQDGAHLLPVRRGPQLSSHPHWEFILEPGRAWDDPADTGWTRAALPFALQERNANCTHNGLLTFLFREDGQVSRVAYQVGSETCQYLQLDLWGVAPARYTPGPVAGRNAVMSDYRNEQEARLPLRPLADLAQEHPGSNPDRLDWFPAEERSTFGFVIDGVHYSGGCHTRHGPYPFCEVLDLPSYSLAKSISAGLSFMLLEQAYPGAAGLAVSDHVPECAQLERWQGVTLRHLVDMTTGNFLSLEPNSDEYLSYETDFMGGDTHEAKITTACTLFPRQANPGTAFAYHTSDTYIAGSLMKAFLGTALDPQFDIHTDLLVTRLFEPLALGPLTYRTRRTYDDAAQPFAGYGLTLHADDIARLAVFLARGDGRIGDRQVLEPRELRLALQREPQVDGLQAGAPDLRYRSGFWAYHTDLGGACSEPVWLPFMSGYGGISVVLMPNETVFYVFSDHGRHEWLAAAIESNRIRPFCD